MKEDGLSLYTLDTRQFTDAAYFRECYAELSPFRQAKIDRYCFLKDKMLSLGAGILLDRGLSKYGLREVDVRIGQKKNGKPYLLDYPWIHFNLAHSEDMALAVFSDAEVGCDIEYTKKADLKLAEKCFCPQEYAFLSGLPEEKCDSAFFQFWTLKESFLKAAGMGMELPLNAFGFYLSGGNIRVDQNYDTSEYTIRQYCFGRYWAAVCIQSF